MASVLTRVKYHLERIDGQEVQKPLPKLRHAILQKLILIELSKLEGQLGVQVLPELDVLVGGGDWVVPDLVVAARGTRFENGMLAGPAELAIEILSPGQAFSDLLDKCERLHRAGTVHCWVFWPEKREAWHYMPDDFRSATQTLSAGDIHADVAKLFADLEAEAGAE